MARSDVANLAIKVGAIYVAYRLALGGALGDTLRAEAAKIDLALRGADTSGAPKATTPPADKPACDTSFIPGVRYVAPAVVNGVSGFEVVINRQRVHFTTDQTEAEKVYNARVCGG